MTIADPAAVVRTHLASYLGPFTSTHAVRMAAKNQFGIDPDQIRLGHVPSILNAIAPLLRTLLGSTSADLVIAAIKKELGLS